MAFFDTGLDKDSGRTGTNPAHACFDSAAATSRLYDSLLVPGSMTVPCGGGTTTLNAIDCMIQDDTTWNGEPLKVVNISFDGWPDPEHPVEEALDQMANDLDVLVVASASNDGDFTRAAHGFLNGLAVGAVEKRTIGGADFVAPYYSARGPLQGQPNRTFPDVCAVGGTFTPLGTWGNAPTLKTAHVDEDTWASVYPNARPRESVGTSDAAAQVTGAATLYAARRLAIAPAPTATEIRPAILACVADPTPSTPVPQVHTYANRNAYGVGFVNDRYLAEFAERFGTAYANPLISARIGPRLFSTPGQEARVVPSTPGQHVDTLWAGLTAGSDYVVTAAWNRNPSPATADLDDIDLEILDATGTTRIAQSASRVHPFERVVFRALGSTSPQTVTIRLIRQVGFGVPTAVHIAARLHPESHLNKQAVHGMVEVIPQPACAPSVNPNQVVTRVLPTSYAEAYGSTGFPAPGSGGGSVGTAYLLDPNAEHWLFRDSIVGGAATITGLALRSWRPFNIVPILSTGATTIQVRLLGLSPADYGMKAALFLSPGDQTPPTRFDIACPAQSGGRRVAQNQLVNLVPPPGQRLPASSAADLPNAQQWNVWNFRIPFNQAFVYMPTGANPGLAVWLDATWSGPPGFRLPVDGINDFLPPATEVRRKVGYLTIESVGIAPVLGLVLDGTAKPTLEVLGEPAAADGVWLVAHGFGKAPPMGSLIGVIQLVVGTSRIDAPLGPCQLLIPSLSVQSPWISFPLLGGADVLDFGLTLSPSLLGGTTSLLYRDLWVQAVHFDGSSFQSSNGLRMRIGGKL